MSVNVHNPDQYMASLRTIIAQGRKKIGLLVSAGAPAGMAKADGTYPLVPAVAGLTAQVVTALTPKYGVQIAGLKAELPKDDIETILSRVRALAKVIGKSHVHDLDGPGFEKLGEDICVEIGKIVDARLPKPESAYADLINWVTGTSRDCPIEIFTTNYDLLLEEAFEAVRAPYFDASPVVENRSSTQFLWRGTICRPVGRACGNFTDPSVGVLVKRAKSFAREKAVQAT